MRKLFFMLKGIFFTGLTLVWIVLLMCMFVFVRFVYKTWIPMMDTPIEVPQSGHHGLGPF